MTAPDTRDSVERIVAEMREMADWPHATADRMDLFRWADRLSALPQQAGGEDDDGVANCAECGAFLERVRPGKHQHPECSHVATALQAEVARLLIRIETLRSTADRATVRAEAAEAALREAGRDAERLDWMECVGFTTRNREGTKDVMNVHSWVNDSGGWTWTAQYIGSEFPTARAAIDAALNGGQDDA